MKKMMLSTKQINDFRTTVYDFFKKHGRTLPWRPPALTPDENGIVHPYKVLVSEVMLQQTQVERVVSFYESFIEALPTIEMLAHAPLKKVLALWQGLGYNRRAQFLHQTAKRVVSEHDGTLPSSVEELEKLPGIGPATARSVAVFAYDQPIAFIETNIRSVFLYHFFPGEDSVPDAAILPLVASTLDTQNPRRWYSALMDYGSMLKKQYSNPSRRSKHHTVQSAFRGSNRQVRGAIIRALVKGGPQTIAALARTSGFSKKRIKKVVEQLQEEGFIKDEKGKVILKE